MNESFEPVDNLPSNQLPGQLKPVERSKEDRDQRQFHQALRDRLRRDAKDRQQQLCQEDAVELSGMPEPERPQKEPENPDAPRSPDPRPLHEPEEGEPPPADQIDLTA